MVTEIKGTIKDGTTLLDILKSTFPAASITGAPKIRAMEIIKESELSAREIYTGTIGCITPENNFCFNVPIRTIINKKENAILSIGSGIIADSVAENEWKESLLKKEFINNIPPQFDVLETVLYDHKNGFHFLDEHLERAQKSQTYFCRTWDVPKINNALQNFTPKHKLSRVRFLFKKDGTLVLEEYPLEKKGWGKEKIHITISNEKVNSNDIFLYHKTTHRNFYNSQFKNALEQGFDELIFLNERDELTEGAISNIFIQINGKWFTPPITSGLLPGIWRSQQIERLNASEKVITRDNLKTAQQILLGNSVRGTIKANINNHTIHHPHLGTVRRF
jgi:para-aminobenzoate synthetase/4-amino-4-deoxychorismate lyase